MFVFPHLLLIVQLIWKKSVYVILYRLDLQVWGFSCILWALFQEEKGFTY